MPKFTVYKVSTVDEIDELPDFNFLPANFFEICCRRKKNMEKINMSRRKTAVQSLRGFFDVVDICELTGHATPSCTQSYSHNCLQIQRKILHGSSTNVQNNTETTNINFSKDGFQRMLSSIFNFLTLL